MQGPKKKTGGASADMSIAEHGARGSIKDPQAARMLAMGRTIGNDELQRRLDQGSATRDEMLSYLSNRLSAMREAQVREESFGKDSMRTAWKDIADQHKMDITKPEPMRYREAARMYEEAAYQLSRGALGRGADLMKRAMAAERKAFEGVGKQIGVKDLEPDGDGPAVMEDVKPEQACPPCDVPSEIEKKADEIQRNTTEFKDQPVRRRVADPWWTLDEEEEEEQPGDGA